MHTDSLTQGTSLIRSVAWGYHTNKETDKDHILFNLNQYFIMAMNYLNPQQPPNQMTAGGKHISVTNSYITM